MDEKNNGEKKASQEPQGEQTAERDFSEQAKQVSEEGPANNSEKEAWDAVFEHLDNKNWSEVFKHLKSQQPRGAYTIKNSKEVSTEQTLIDSNYEILKIIGEGGGGKVLKVLNKNLDRIEALKILKKDDTKKDDNDILRFHREAKVISALKREFPNIYIPEVFSFHQKENAFYYTMELIEGDSLKKYIDLKKLDLKKTLILIKKLTQTLEMIHKKDILHRDLKPDNILIDVSENPWLVDFGILKKTKKETKKLTKPGYIIGTLLHMSPEQVKGEVNITPASDIYSLGTVLYQMITNKYTVSVGTAEEIMTQVAFEDTKPPSLLVEGLNEDIDYVCLKTLNKAPEERYQNASELREDIEKLLKNIQ